jgi:hypothetical protein
MPWFWHFLNGGVINAVNLQTRVHREPTAGGLSLSKKIPGAMTGSCRGPRPIPAR